MKKPEITITKDKLVDLVNTVGNATKNTVATVSESVKDGSEQLSKHIDKVRFENDRKRLCPIFQADIEADDFRVPPMIRIVEYDKRRDNKACEGAIGFETNTKDMKVLNIYSEFVPILNLSFYPYVKESVFYVDPCHSDLYISLDEYFGYLKKVRVDELESIAQDLGAKHVKIALKEHKKSVTKQNMNVNAQLKLKANIDVDRFSNELSNIEIAAEVDFSGREIPVQPTLVYFKNESDINALVKMRLNPNNQNQILSKTYSFQYNNSSGIQIKEAAKIDAALSQMNYNMGVSVFSEAQCESRTILEYSIVF